MERSLNAADLLSLGFPRTVGAVWYFSTCSGVSATRTTLSKQATCSTKLRSISSPDGSKSPA